MKHIKLINSKEKLPLVAALDKCTIDWSSCPNQDECKIDLGGCTENDICYIDSTPAPQ